MGWLFGWSTRGELADHLISGNGVKTIKHAWKGNNLWAVQEGTKRDGTKELFIALYLTKGRTNSSEGWGYKDMDETAGPYYYNCPISFLNMVPDPGGYATEWRAQVLSRALKAKQKFSVGQKITLYGKPYTITEVLPKGQYRIDNGAYGVYRTTLKHRRHMELVV